MKSIKKNYKIKGAVCLNCRQRLSINDNFCRNCGQINDTRRIRLKHYFSEYLSGFFSFDNRFTKTIIPLIFKPGKVTREYIEGKRKKYVNPFQLYLHITIIFFLMLGFFNTIEKFKLEEPKSNITINNDEEKDSIISDIEKDLNVYQYNHKQAPIDTIKGTSSTFIKKIEHFIEYSEKNDSIATPTALKNMGYKNTYWNRYAYAKSKNVHRFVNDPEFIRSYAENITSKISIALFFLLPVFTLIVSLLYFRSKYNYTEHLVFVFHTQTVFFILLIFFTFFDEIFQTDIGTLIFLFLFLFYLYKALRNFYKQNRFKTIVKYLILNTVFLFLASFGGIIISFIAFLL